MEAVMFHSSPDHQPMSPYKSHIETIHKRGSINRPLISRPTSDKNFTPFVNLYNNTGVLQAPPHYNLSHSFPPFSLQQNQQPPILPLPISTRPNNYRVRGLSCPPTNRKTNNHIKIRDSSLTPKKSKNIPKKVEILKPMAAMVGQILSPSLTIEPLGPDPKDLPKDDPKVLTLLSGNINSTISPLDHATKDQVDGFSGSVAFTTLSPPPSSLPLPTFSLRPKLSCNAEAAGIDAGATDNLRRLLRLR